MLTRCKNARGTVRRRGTMRQKSTSGKSDVNIQNLISTVGLLSNSCTILTHGAHFAVDGEISDVKRIQKLQRHSNIESSLML